MDFLSNLISGLSLGSIYALIALGYTMVYGIAKMLNFAHGDIIMVGAFAVIVSVGTCGLPIWLTVIVSILCCTVLGVLIERVAYKPLRRSPPLTVLITAIGVSYLLQSLAQLVFGSEMHSFPKIVNIPALKLGELTIKGDALATLAVSALIMVALTLFIGKTRMGKAMRAVSEDKDAAELMGISVNQTISVTFAIGSALAAVGGIGSIPGARIGGLALGVIENLAKAYISTELSDAIVFGVLIVVLLFKPTGLLGKKIKEKV